MRVILGIDPGARGAIAVLGEEGTLIGLHDMPAIKIKVGKTIRERFSSHGFRDLIKSIPHIKMVVIERVGGMKSDGGSAAFTFGYACGGVEGVLVTLDIPIAFITPQRWKKHYSLSSDKGTARMIAMQIWPNQAASFARVKDDGRAEAALIAQLAINPGYNHDSFDR